MSKNNIKVVHHRRKREGKTNFKKRLELLKSRTPRLVVRKSLKYITAQIVKYEARGDKIIEHASSKELSKLGWDFSGKNIPSAYLVGMLIAKKAAKASIKNVVLDIGMQRNVAKSRLYAVAKGANDNGLNVPCDENMFPAQERIDGKHISDHAKNAPEAFTKTKQAEKIADIFSQVKEKITG